MTTSRTRNIKYYLAAASALTTFLVYLPALRNDFVEWDDGMYVLENVHIRSLDAAFFKWAFFDFHAANWHPLTWLSHALDYAVWGLNPLGHHLTNIMLHAANTFVVVLLVMRLLEAHANGSDRLNGPSRGAWIAAGVTGLLFGLHPIHVESVAWVAERKDLLCALFYMLSVMWYVKYVNSWQLAVGSQGSGAGSRHSTIDSQQSTIRRRYLITLGLFVLALMSKPMAVSLPVVLLILDWYPFGRIQTFKTFWAASVEKFPFMVLSLCSSLVTILAQKTGEALVSIEFAPLTTRILVAGQSLVAYLWKMAAPFNLMPFYPHPQHASLLSLPYIATIALVSGITAACLTTAKKQKLWLAVWTYYVATLIPVLGIIQMGGQAMADRYTYLPSLGPFLVLGLMAARIAEKADTLKQGKVVIRSACAAALMLFAFLTYLTIGQISIWKNGVDLWSYVIEKEPDKVPLAYNNRGLALKKMGQLDKAIEDYDTAISLNPRNYEAYNNRGILYGNAGLFGKAIEYFDQSIANNPNDPNTFFNRGFTYSLMGRYESALEDFNKTIGLDRNFAIAYLSRGKVYAILGSKELAISDFRKACELGIDDGCKALHLFMQGLPS